MRGIAEARRRSAARKLALAEHVPAGAAADLGAQFVPFGKCGAADGRKHGRQGRRGDGALPGTRGPTRRGDFAAAFLLGV